MNEETFVGADPHGLNPSHFVQRPASGKMHPLVHASDRVRVATEAALR